MDNGKKFINFINKHKDYRLSLYFNYFMVGLIYPTTNEIQYYNAIAIEMFRRSKHDQAKTINVSFIQKAIDKTKMNQGELYDKAARLLVELTRTHAFESGNKRTAFLTTKSL